LSDEENARGDAGGSRLCAQCKVARFAPNNKTNFGTP
jgi:hypothetical protein